MVYIQDTPFYLIKYIMNNLFWSMSTNFGDALSPLMYKFFSGEDAIYTPTQSSPKHLSIGSILNHAQPGDIVWGSGLAWLHDRVSTGLTITATRGHITKSICERAGNSCPDVFGDPAMLLPLMYDPSKITKYKLGIIPHIVDYNYISIPEKYSNECTKIDLNLPPEDVVSLVTSCDNIISSSLHGLIVADAYDIPNAWCKFSDRVLGDDTKFYDHFTAVRRRYMSPLLWKGDTNFTCDQMIEIVGKCDQSKFTSADRQLLLNSCPFNLK